MKYILKRTMAGFAILSIICGIIYGLHYFASDTKTINPFTSTPAPAGLIMVPDGKGAFVPVQGFAPKAKDDVLLTTKKETFDMRPYTAWSVYSNNTTSRGLGNIGGVYRSMTSATVIGVAKPVPQRVWHTRIVDKTYSPFVSFTGVRGALERQ